MRAWTARVWFIAAAQCVLACSPHAVATGPLPDAAMAAHPEDSGASSPPMMDAGPITKPPMMMMTDASSSPPSFSFDAGQFLPMGRQCAVQVAAPCDGPEDCELPESCCATYDSFPPRYAQIGCKLSCEALRGEFELCHPAMGCRVRDFECRRSLLLPFDFATVCAPPSMDVAKTTTSEQIAGAVLCGDDRCVANDEQCCLRAEYDFSSRTLEPIEPYCAPAGSECTCASSPLPPDEDSGADPGG